MKIVCKNLLQTMSSTKFCKECCCELPREDFYKTYGKTISTLCKFHSNEKRKKLQKENPKPKKQLGFKKLPQEIQDQILNDLAQRR